MTQTFRQTLKSGLLGAAFVLGAGSIASAQITITYAEGGPNRGTRSGAVQDFADTVKRLTDGEVEVDIHWGGALVSLTATPQAVRDGVADAGTVLGSYDPSRLAGFFVGDLPTQYSDPWVIMRAMYELMTTNETQIQMLADQNLVYLGNFTTTGLNFECNGTNKIESIADFAGKKIRASGTYAKVLNDLGATTMNMGFQDVYQALDTGLIDCTTGYFYTAAAYKTFEVANHFSIAQWGGIGSFGIMMNKQEFDDFSAEHQQAFLDAGSEMIDRFARAQIEEMVTIRAGLESGEIGRQVTVFDFPAEDLLKMEELGNVHNQDWVEQINAMGHDGQAMFDEYRALLAKYDAEREELGYPWQR